MDIGWGRLQELGDGARDLCEDLATISSCIVLEVVEYLPAAQQRTQMQRRTVREAFAAGRNYERQRLGLAPPQVPTPPEPQERSARHLHLVSG